MGGGGLGRGFGEGVWGGGLGRGFGEGVWSTDIFHM